MSHLVRYLASLTEIMLLKKYFFFVILLFLFHNNKIFATHIRAGEIIAVSKGILNYEVTFILYRNTSGVDQRNATINFGDGSAPQVIDITSRVITVQGASQSVINSKTEKLIFTTRHTFPGPGTYTISVREENRNGGIINMTNSNNIAFYVETQITIDPLLGGNSSPQFLVDPIDEGAMRRVFTHAPGAYDPDGDSLSFKLTTPKSDKDVLAFEYKDPNQIEGSTSINGGPATFAINPVTGLITWDSPAPRAGLYNIAFIIEEWRNGVKIGYTTRDMQVEISQNDNNPPNLFIPKDTCILAGRSLKDTIKATDDFNSTVLVSGFSGVFNLSNSPATFKKVNLTDIVPVTYTFNWNTNCSHIRQQPYLVTFKATDNPTDLASSLVTEKVWQIRVIPPPLELKPLASKDKSLNLNWKKYFCTNIDSIVILRRTCGNDTIIQDSCTTGNRWPNGFTKIKTVSPSDTSYTDFDVEYGKNYCYAIYAEFPEPQKGFSRLSNIECKSLDIEVPLILNVSVTKTDTLNGEILLRWKKPQNLNFTNTYKIIISRADSIEKKIVLNKFLTNAINDTSQILLSDTTLIDAKVNVFKKYNYQIAFLKNADTIYKSTINNNILLKGLGRYKLIQLQWPVATSWSNYKSYIYFNNASIAGERFTILDSTTNVNAYNFSIAENNPLKPHRFYIQTVGKYGCSELLSGTQLSDSLFNLSQEILIFTVDSIADTLQPCPPRLFAKGLVSCVDALNGNSTEKTLYWSPNLSFGCDIDILKYEVYENEQDQNTLIASVGDTFLLETSEIRFSKCYCVKAINKRNQKSAFSNKVCFLDLCEYYELPNIFTPNGDGINDEFKPIPFPSSIFEFNIKIYNRWGTKVHETNNFNVNWTAQNQEDGLYYYIATLRFGNNEVQGSQKTIKGWVQVVR